MSGLAATYKQAMRCGDSIRLKAFDQFGVDDLIGSDRVRKKWTIRVENSINRVGSMLTRFRPVELNWFTMFYLGSSICYFRPVRSGIVDRLSKYISLGSTHGSNWVQIQF